jgi:uncharacterized membrane protein YccC
MLISPVPSLKHFIYSHYFVSALRISFGLLLVFLVAYLMMGTKAAAVAALGAAYVAFIDRPGAARERAKEMLSGAVLGALAVCLTGFLLNQPLALVIALVAQAFFFSMLVVYGLRGATIGLACLSLAAITMPSGLSPDNVLGYTLLSFTGALGYILYSIVSGHLLQLREARQCLGVALYATSKYMAARAHMYDQGLDINKGYRELIAAQSMMINLQNVARNIILGNVSTTNVQTSPARLMLWNVTVDMSNLLDLVISTKTDYALLHQKLDKSEVLVLMHDTLTEMGLALQQVAMAVAGQKPSSRSHRLTDRLKALQARLQAQLQAMQESHWDRDEPQAYAICLQIHHRLSNLQVIINRMIEQTHMPANAKPLQLSFLEKSFDSLMSGQSFNPKLLISNLGFQSAAFRFALRVSLAVGIAMAIGTQVPDTGAHGYWIVLTVIVIMKPAFSLTKKRNFARLKGTLIGCALVFALLHITTKPEIILGVLVIAMVLCVLFAVTNNYTIFSMFVSVTVLLALHGLLPDSVNFPTERALDTVIGSLIALACSFVLPSWESKSMPDLATNAVQANERLLRATVNAMSDPSSDPLDWHTHRQAMQIAFSNFSQGFNRMMAEPAAHQSHVVEYSNLVIDLHVMAGETVNVFNQVQAQPAAVQHAQPILEQLANALAGMDEKTLPKVTDSDDKQPRSDWAYALQQLQNSTQQVIATYKSLGLKVSQ